MALVVAGLLLRLVTMLLYFPTALQWQDAIRFSRIGPWHALFSDYYMPAGYALFLKITHAVTTNVALTTGLQHLMGLGLGALIFFATRRFGIPAWLALVPAALAILGGEQLYLEHILMNDFLFAFLLVTGLCIGAYGLSPTPRLCLLALAGLVLGASGLIRQTGLALPLVLAACALLAGEARLGQRFGRAGAVLVPAVLLVGMYAGVVNVSGGQYTGLTDMGGWNLYARVAPFADCHAFSPPPGTRVLCEATPPQQRNGSFWYAWSPASRGMSVLGVATPRNAHLPQEFARAVVENQPGMYVRTVVKDVLRYADPNLGDVQGWSGESPDTVSFEQGLVDPVTSNRLNQIMGSYWSDLKPQLHHIQALAWYGSLTTISGLAWVVLVVVSVLGIAFGRGSPRVGAALFGLSAFAIYLLPAMTLSWDWRYGIPAQVPLLAGACCSTWALVAAVRARRGSGFRWRVDLPSLRS